MVFNFAGKCLNGKHLSEKERLEIFRKMVKRQDNIDKRNRDRINHIERPSTEEELEMYSQAYADANRSWEDVKNECI